MKKQLLNQSDVESFYKSYTNESGSYKDGVLRVNDETGRVEIHFYNEIPGMEMSVVTARVSEDTLFIDESKDENIVVLRFVLNSHLYIKNNDPDKVSLVPIDGACMYSTKNRYEYIVKKDELVQFVTIRLDLSSLNRFNGPMWKGLEALVKSDKPWFLFESLDLQMENNLKDVFAIQELKSGRFGFTLGKIATLITQYFVQLEQRKDDTKAIGNLTVPVEVLMEIKSELIKNLERKVSVEDLAKKFHMSSQKLRINFKAFFGKSPGQFLQQERFQEAERRLIYSKDPITSVGLDLGFYDSAHFASEFRKRYKCTPEEYRNGD